MTLILIGYSVMLLASLFLIWKVWDLHKLHQVNDNTIETQTQYIERLNVMLDTSSELAESQRTLIAELETNARLREQLIRDLDKNVLSLNEIIKKHELMGV